MNVKTVYPQFPAKTDQKPIYASCFAGGNTSMPLLDLKSIISTLSENHSVMIFNPVIPPLKGKDVLRANYLFPDVIKPAVPVYYPAESLFLFID